MTPTSEERREVAAMLLIEVKDEDTSLDYPVHRIINDVLGVNGAWGDKAARILADLIDPTCVYEPTETLTRWDENDYEHETNEPDFDCATFACSRCGYGMLYGDEYGWFDTEPPYAPHFKFCPNCSARVLPLKLYDKVVTNDDE